MTPSQANQILYYAQYAIDIENRLKTKTRFFEEFDKWESKPNMLVHKVYFTIIKGKRFESNITEVKNLAKRAGTEVQSEIVFK